MKKNITRFLTVIFVLAFCFSCTNNDTSFIPTETASIEESASLIFMMDKMKEHFDNQGNPLPSENPTGNITVDFCFDFVYPINLIYNNGTIVTVTNFEDLVAILINTTESLYISGIEFPFQVKVFNPQTQSIEIKTISNETEFQELLDSCIFEDCNCDTTYEPVCISITLADGTSSIIEFPNECTATCYGITYENLLNCTSDCNCPIAYDPVCIYDSELGIIEYPNSCEAICDGYTEADFVDCNGCSIYALDIFPGDCYIQGTYNLFIDFEYTVTTNYPYFDMYLENNEYYGSIPIADLPVVILNFPISGNQYDYIKICIDGGTDCCIESQWISPYCTSPDISHPGAVPTGIIYNRVND